MKARHGAEGCPGCSFHRCGDRLGYLYPGPKVEMLQSNAKLKERAVPRVAELTGTELDVA